VATVVLKSQPTVQRVAFFQSCLPTSDTTSKPTPYDTPSIQSLIALFLSRFDSELATLKAERRPGRPPATREVAIKQQLELDNREYDSGLWIPDLRDEETLFSLRNWQGEWSGLNTMGFVRVTRKGEVKESSFPPKGQS
jgi:translation machinery-associated protein 16